MILIFDVSSCTGCAMNVIVERDELSSHCLLKNCGSEFCFFLDPSRP